MPLDPPLPRPGERPLAGVALNQVTDLLLGRMTDQAVSLGNSLTVRSATPSSVAVLALTLGSSGPGFYFGSSAPTIAANPPSLFFNTGGSSGTGLYMAISNSGGASSSNWNTFVMS